MLKTVTSEDYDTDNRGEDSTEIVLHGLRIDVDPIDLFENMLENCFDPDGDYRDGLLTEDRVKKVWAKWEELKSLMDYQ